MRRLELRYWVGLSSALVIVLASAPAAAAFYWGFGTLSTDPSVCFVGDALADRPARVAQILDYMSEFERVANIDFDYLGTCPDPTIGPTGLDWHDGDIRIYIPGVGIPWNIPVPGNGCTIGFVNSSFGREPSFLTQDRPCLYNLKLGDDGDASGVPWRNHTLHEVGHSLGLAHEHQRPDALDPSTCVPMASSCPVPADPANELLCMTGYDRESVMNYVIAACGIDGNYSNSGLSELDKLGLQILYPEDVRVARVVGTRVVKTREILSLGLDWARRGADMSVVATNYDWRLGGVTYSSGPSLVQSLGAGVYPLTLTHRDFLGRTYSYASVARVLTADDFERTIAGPVAAYIVPEPDTIALLAFGSAALIFLSRGRRGRLRGHAVRAGPITVAGHAPRSGPVAHGCQND